MTLTFSSYGWAWTKHDRVEPTFGHMHIGCHAPWVCNLRAPARQNEFLFPRKKYLYLWVPTRSFPHVQAQRACTQFSLPRVQAFVYYFPSNTMPAIAKRSLELNDDKVIAVKSENALEAVGSVGNSTPQRRKLRSSSSPMKLSPISKPMKLGSPRRRLSACANSSANVRFALIFMK